MIAAVCVELRDEAVVAELHELALILRLAILQADEDSQQAANSQGWLRGELTGGGYNAQRAALAALAHRDVHVSAD